MNTKLAFKTILSIVLAATCSIGFAQDKKPSNSTMLLIHNSETNSVDTVYTIVDEMPEYPGGNTELRRYIAEHIQYPSIAKENGISGKVYVRFVINEKGEIENVQISKGIDPSLDKEAIRVVKNQPIWKPGKIQGKTVKVLSTIPIIFQLNTDSIPIIPSMPQFPGGDKGFNKYFVDNLKIIERSELNKSGSFSFFINEQGYVGKVHVIQTINSTIDSIVIDVLKSMPQWIPGKYQGNPAEVGLTITIKFDKKGKITTERWQGFCTTKEN